MSGTLPAQVLCITLEHLINSKPAIEVALSENPNVATCIPVMIRNTIFQQSNELEPINKIPDAQTTLKILSILWDDDSVYDKFVRAADDCLLHLMSYIFFSDDPEKPGEQWMNNPDSTILYVVEHAAIVGNTSVIKWLNDIAAIPEEVSVIKTLVSAAKNSHADTVAYVLGQFIAGEDAPHTRTRPSKEEVIAATAEAAAFHGFPKVLDVLPHDFLPGGLLVTAARGDHYNTVKWVIDNIRPSSATISAVLVHAAAGPRVESLLRSYLDPLKYVSQ